MGRRFQFSLRALLVATTGAAVLCAWVASRLEEKRKERAIVGEINARIGHVTYDWQLDEPGRKARGRPHGWDWCRQLLGDDFFSTVKVASCGDDVTDADLATITRLKTIEMVFIGNPCGINPPPKLINTRVTDAGLTHFNDSKQLKTIHLYYTAISDAGIADLKTYLPNCDIRRSELTEPRSKSSRRVSRQAFLFRQKLPP